MTETPNTDQDLEAQIAEEMGDEETTVTVDTETGEIIEDAGSDEPAALSQADIEKRMKSLDKEAERHTKAVARIMGDDFELLAPSPVDWTPGFIFNIPEMLPSPEAVDALLALLGRSDARDLKPAPDAEPCSTCNAWGIVLTGSKAPGQETKPCSDCTGNGWKTKVAPLAPVTTFDYATNAGTVPLQPNQPIQAADQWGRQAGHPHYGLNPASIGV